MRRDRGRAPVIIIGMHRSGTSLITRMLEELGLFVGWRKDPNHEALLFQKINDWLMRQSSANWDNPKTFVFLLRHERLRALAVDYIRYLLKTPRVFSYLGWSKYLRYRTPFALNIRWGWKDPRNTFTLPVWLDIFPEARVIHVIRHGVDVAGSLKKRQEKVFSDAMATYKMWKPLLWVWFKRDGFSDTPRCASVQGGFFLWEEYVSQARDQMRRLGDQALEIKYEACVDNPVVSLKKLCNFIELAVDEETVRKIAATVRKDSLHSHLRDPSLRAFAEEACEQLQRYGY